MQQLKAAGIPVISVSEITGFPEMMDGRVKTSSEKVHGGFSNCDNPECRDMKTWHYRD